MAERTAISWADDTWNPWEGCQETGSIACIGCYARERNLRYAPKGSTEAPNWGPHAPRRRTSKDNWRKPYRWEREAANDNLLPMEQRRWPGGRFVFCASLADIFDNRADPAWRAEAFQVMRETPHLTYLLLTKRPQNIIAMCEAAGGLPPNAAIGCTVVTQKEADRDVPHLLRAKAALNPAFAFLSMEPLVERVNLKAINLWTDHPSDALTGKYAEPVGDSFITKQGPRIDWVITGGMTSQGKHKAPPANYDDFRFTRDQCANTGTVYHHKQNGEWAYGAPPNIRQANDTGRYQIVDGQWMTRVGKRVAGRELDGQVHDARPVPGAWRMAA